MRDVIMKRLTSSELTNNVSNLTGAGVTSDKNYPNSSIGVVNFLHQKISCPFWCCDEPSKAQQEIYSFLW
jgi:hypothetical protein